MDPWCVPVGGCANDMWVSSNITGSQRTQWGPRTLREKNTVALFGYFSDGKCSVGLEYSSGLRCL